MLKCYFCLLLAMQSVLNTFEYILKDQLPLPTDCPDLLFCKKYF